MGSREQGCKEIFVIKTNIMLLLVYCIVGTVLEYFWRSGVVLNIYEWFPHNKQ